MKLSTVSLLALSTAAINARFVEQHETNQVVLNADAAEEQYLVELAPGDTRWVTEDEKWELRRVSTAREWPSEHTDDTP
jgi:leucyl aminopeptidase